MSKTGKEARMFQEFSSSSKADWIAKATADLKGADFGKKLVWKNLNDFEVQPFYTLEDRKETLSNSGGKAGSVINYRRIDREAKNKNVLAHKAISEGINGIVFEVSSSDKIESLLKGLNPEKTAISYSLPEESKGFPKGIVKFYQETKVKKSNVQGYLELPVLSNFLTQGNMEETSLEALAEVSQVFADFPSFKTLAISGKEYLDSGANQTQEIAFTLNSIVFLVEEMKKRGLKEELIFDKLHVTLAIGSEYFLEIAKLRAFKSLLHLVAEKYGVHDPNCALMSRSSMWTKSVLDVNTNMLRATTETMSALLGNSNAIEIDPYDKETGTTRDLSRRIAGNIAIILREESYFDKVQNPVDGSYYIEELTHLLAGKALELFKETEKNGGFLKAMELQEIQNKIAMVRTTKIKLVSRRRKALVGVNKYPNLMEKLSKELLSQEKLPYNSKFLRPRRAGLELEVVRANTEQWVEDKGHRPIVEFAGFGSLTMRKARAGFAYDFLGVGGYEMREERSYKTALEAAESSARSDSDIVVICSSDEDYKESAFEFVSAFRALNDSKVLLLAGFPADISDRLTKAGLDAFIHVGSDILDTLNFIHQKLVRTSKTLNI